MPSVSRRQLLAWGALAASEVGCDDPLRRGSSSSATATAPSSALLPEAMTSAASTPPPAVPPAGIALFRAFPKLERAVPRAALGAFPTPILRAEGLATRVGASDLWVKRDDETSPVYGGGKVRKLELFFGEALAKGHRSVVTFGGAGSNQAVATALLGRSLGLDVTVCLAPQPAGETVRANLRILCQSGATVRAFDSVSTAERAIAAHPDGAYVIPMGGTSALGNLGFVSAGLELAEQIAASALPAPTRIYAALGSGGSALGLAIGLCVAGIRSEVVAVRASNPTTVTRATLSRMLEETASFAATLGAELPKTIDALAIRIEGRFVGRGYGYATREGAAARALARATEPFPIEPVYTAKALAALVADAKKDGPVLFWASAGASPIPDADEAPLDRLPAALRRLASAPDPPAPP